MSFNSNLSIKCRKHFDRWYYVSPLIKHTPLGDGKRNMEKKILSGTSDQWNEVYGPGSVV